MPIPTFTPGNSVNVAVNDIPKFQASGNAAAADLWGDVSRQMGQVAENYQKINDDIQTQQQTRAGYAAGAKDGFDPAVLQQDAASHQSQAFQKGATTAYLSRLDIDTDAALAGINSQTFEDPDSLRARMQAHIDGVAQGMPEDIGAQYKMGAMRQANAYYTNSLNASGARVRKDQEADVIAGINLSEDKLKSLGMPDSPAAMDLRTQEVAKFNVKINSAVDAGLMTPQQGELRRQQLNGELQDSTIFHAVSNAPDKMAFALNIANGHSGTDLDLLPSDKRYRAVTVAQQILNGEEAAQKQAEKVRIETNAATITNAGQTILQDPLDPGARQVASKLMTLASTPEQVDQADKLRSYVMAPNATRFTNGNQSYSDYLELQAARGNLEQRQVYAAWGNPSANTRVDTGQLQRLNALVDAKPKSIVGSNSWKTVVSQMESEFPVPERARSGMSGLIAQFMNLPDDVDAGQKGSNGLSHGQMQSNQRLVTQELMDMQQKIAKGDIDSENSLTSYAGKRMAELRQYYNATPGTKRVVLPEQLQGAKVVAQQRPEIEGLMNKYQNNREAFLRDVKNKTLDVTTANTLNRLMKEPR